MRASAYVYIVYYFYCYAQKETQLNILDFLTQGIRLLNWQMVLMWLVGGVLIYLAIEKEFEPALLLPMGIRLYS